VNNIRPKVVVFDGVDNTGKTWLIEKLGSILECDTCKFPSDELANSKEFKDVCYEPTYENRERWLKALIEEEHFVLSNLLKHHQSEVVLVDRMWYSTHIYQGDGPELNFLFERAINDEYHKLMRNLPMSPEQIAHVIPLYPLTSSDERETNEVKKAFDNKQVQLLEKLCHLIIARKLKHSHVYTPYLSNTYVFCESLLAVHWNVEARTGLQYSTYLSVDDIEEIQNNRIPRIIDIIYGNRPVNQS
jgi:hypothetical protein